jgi:hypothetical protein
MVSLPPSKGFDAIMVVVDRFSKIKMIRCAWKP